ncbi:MAG TPA: guanylate kinase [Deltaproteobacteria bacterium]|nr:guanylate kinase [Deltaproteobacteria bacterium]MDI9544212.1 guanylate kinase [Pseudomonadota bacterium]HNU74004.1 guanylate kinase [Deltaproteobacteria bacterium]HOD70878.1 guanylate kinase [Deltaproteobacteria bacterium]HOE72220.1 guanylate kinase [Deltaproteobacteria bacterium]
MRIFVSGPSGVGKSTIIAEILKRNPDFVLSVSYTTRTARPREVHGKDYFFVSAREFEDMMKKNEFLEWARVHDNLYGTSLSWVESQEKLGRHILLDIDVQGVKQAQGKRVSGTYIFILPPSIDELVKRLAKRGTEDERSFRLRLNNAKDELKAWTMYDYLVVNDDIARAIDDVQSIIDAQRCSRFEMIGRIPWLQEIE